jgi:hypothetical protein
MVKSGFLPMFTLFAAGGAEIHGKASLTSTRRMTGNESAFY